MLKVAARLFGDRVHDAAAQARVRSKRAVVPRRPRYSPLLWRMHWCAAAQSCRDDMPVVH